MGFPQKLGESLSGLVFKTNFYLSGTLLIERLDFELLMSQLEGVYLRHTITVIK
jgi:hypothetical protein